MKKYITFIVFLLYFSSIQAQEQGKTLIFGKVLTSDKNFEPLSYMGFRYIISLPNQKTTFGYCEVDSLGRYSKLFPHGAEVSLFPSYPEFYGDTISFKTEKKEKIEENFYIRRKIYPYTEERAQKDIKNKIINLIIYDSTLYYLNQKHNYTKSFGFSYKLIKENHGDNEFYFNVSLYNDLVYTYIDSLYKDNWQREIAFTEDSLINLKLDDYMSKNPVDIDDLTIPPQEFLPQKMLKAIKRQKSEFERLFKDDKSVLSYTPQFIFDKIDSSANYEYLWEASYLIAFHYERMMKELIMRVTNQKYIGLTNTTDLIIHERNEVGDLESYGHGYKVDDDLFTVAGRANYLLRSVTGEEFGYVSMYSTPSYLKRLQNRWIHWLWQLNKK